MAKPLPSIEYLRQRLRYEPETGKLFWLDYEEMPQQWRSVWFGKEAFTSYQSEGYRKGKIDGVSYLAHRVAYALYHAEWPFAQIDHINGIRTDNRIVNLRVVTSQENQHNMTMRSDNTSGITGVTWHKRDRKWAAHIRLSGKKKHLGFFKTIEEAAIARAEASRLYGFTERHGTPTNVGEACD